jgi:hypothetical protein
MGYTCMEVKFGMGLSTAFANYSAGALTPAKLLTKWLAAIEARGPFRAAYPDRAKHE